MRCGSGSRSACRSQDRSASFCRCLFVTLCGRFVSPYSVPKPPGGAFVSSAAKAAPARADAGHAHRLQPQVRSQVGEASQSRRHAGTARDRGGEKSTSAIGSFAPGVTAAVSDELERQFRARASEFADSAVDDLLSRMAQILTDPTRQTEQRELVLSILDFALDLPAVTLRDELSRLDPLAVAADIRKALRDRLSRPDATEELAALAARRCRRFCKTSRSPRCRPGPTPIRALFVELLSTQLVRHLQPPG